MPEPLLNMASRGEIWLTRDKRGEKEVKHITDYKVGTVTHYYDKLGVAIIDLTLDLRVGDLVRVTGSTEFSQKVASMQIEHEHVEEAHAGDTIGLKVNQKVKPGD